MNNKDKKNKKTEEEKQSITEVDVIEETVTYKRKRKIYRFICALEDCPYCRNVPQTSRHPSKKWCSEDARAEAGRRERAAQAIEESRDPGAMGKPVELDKTTLGVFYIHAIDNPKVYRIGYTETLSDYQASYLVGSTKKQNFDAIIIVKTYSPDSLAQKIQRKYAHKHVEDDLYDLTPPEIRVAHQLVLEHLEAYEMDSDMTEKRAALSALLIDDNRNNLVVLQMELINLGYVVTAVNHPARLEDTLDAMDKIDIVFLDLEMPHASGYDVLDQIREIGLDVPVVAYTIHIEELNRIKKHGFSGIVSKPLKIEALPNTIENILNGKKVWRV